MKELSYNMVSKVPQRLWFLVLALLAILFVVLRLNRSHEIEVGLDEAFTWYFASQPLNLLANYVSEYDVHPPLFYLYTKLFLYFEGDIGLRLGAIIAEVLTLPLIFYSAYRLADEHEKRAAGLFALILVGLSFNMVDMAMYARPYSCLYFAFTLCFSALCWIVTDTKKASESILKKSGRSAVLPYVALGSGLAMLPWLHNLGLLYAASLGIVCVLIWCKTLKFSRGAFVNFLVVAIVATLLYIPHVDDLMRQLGFATDYWIESPSIKGLVRITLQVFGQGWNISELNPVTTTFAALLCLSGVIATFFLLRTKSSGPFLVTSALITITLFSFILTTYLVKPVILNRTLIPMLGPWFVLLALFFTGNPASLVRKILGLAMIIYFGAAHFQSSPSMPWKQILTEITKDSDTPPTIVTVPNTAAVLIDYHAKKLELPVDLVPLPREFPATDRSYRYPDGTRGVPALNKEAMTILEQKLTGSSRDTWVYLRAYWAFDPDALLKPFLDKHFCYHPIDGLPGRLHIILRLKNGDGLQSNECTAMGGADKYFPYVRPDYGHLNLLGSAL